LQLTWDRFIVDAIFRSGDKHSNYSDHTEQMIRRVVKLIRKSYNSDVPIIIRMDSGFFDQKIFNACEKLGVGFISGGKIYDDIKMFISNSDKSFWQKFKSDSGKDQWEYIEFGDQRKSWNQYRRVIYCHLMNDGNQLYLPFNRPDTVIYTNLGQGSSIDRALLQTDQQQYLDANSIMACYHERGSDELIHRALKDFGHEQLPFENFYSNAAWYYIMLISFFTHETFKEDVCSSVIPISSYATTVRRKLIDIAGKIVNHCAQIILKVAQVSWETLNFPLLWRNVFKSPVISIV